jgi:hypothetical protein
MTRYVLRAIHFDEQGKWTRLERMVERDWPSVPRIEDLVSLGGGDTLIAPVAVVAFYDGHVRLEFLLKHEEDGSTVAELRDLGFTEPA